MPKSSFQVMTDIATLDHGSNIFESAMVTNSYCSPPFSSLSSHPPLGLCMRFVHVPEDNDKEPWEILRKQQTQPQLKLDPASPFGLLY